MPVSPDLMLHTWRSQLLLTLALYDTLLVICKYAVLGARDFWHRTAKSDLLARG
jgi:hypothetical protein